MNRFSWVTAGEYSSDERVVHQQRGVRLYDGESRVSEGAGLHVQRFAAVSSPHAQTNFDSGTAALTNLRLIWDDEEQEVRVRLVCPPP